MGGLGSKLLGFADADWANDLDDRKSVTGGALMLGNSLIAWHSKKQNMVSTSTAEAEIHAVLEMVFTVQHASSILADIFGSFLGEAIGVPSILTDSQPGLDAIQSRKGRNKHYDVKIKFIAEGIDELRYRLGYIPTRENIADVFTKTVPGPRFRELTNVFMTRAGASANLTRDQI
jgi:hypothetical protein